MWERALHVMSVDVGFLTAALAAGGAGWCGQGVLRALGSLDRAADVSARATRGGQFQVTDTIAPPRQRWHPGDFVTHIDTGGGRFLALTFDDGPSPYNTYSVLRTLADRRIRATFFLIGTNVRAFPEIARDIVSEGHEIGNHSAYHTPYQAYDLSTQIGPNQEIIRSLTGVVPVANRAPGLTRGTAILDRCQEHGMYEVHTDMPSTDWNSPRHSASALFNEFVANHHDGAFALYHDGGGTRPTPVALPLIIDYASSIGYVFETATAMTYSGTPLPGHRSYSTRSASESAQIYQAFPPDDSDVANDVDACNFDTRAALVDRLEDPSIKRAERSRIVEVLAVMDALESDS